jgi:hypothetical protein
MARRVEVRRRPLEAGRSRIRRRHRVREGAHRQGPCVSEGRERRRRGWKARIKEENVFCVIRQWHVRADEGNDGLQKRWAGTVKEEEEGRWGQVGQKD